MCTVLLRYAPGDEWPLLLGAVRDEFADRAWDPPAPHWPAQPHAVGGRDRVAGGTWLALRADRPAVAALLNGVRLPPPPDGAVRPSRGGLPLAMLAEPVDLDEEGLGGYDGFHLLRGTTAGVTVWSWDGTAVKRQDLEPGDHIIVNLGVDTAEDPLVPHFAPLLAATPSPPLTAGAGTARAWDGWADLLRGDSLAGDDPRALIVRREYDGRTYASTSASLVAVNRHGARFDFTATPADPAWTEVPLAPH